ncbi:hypothetical protein BHM03_00038383 [Ensete ventricosum]|nr:hypothetical protein BHM03_00038383 [Ensete ventricosum]
MEIWMSRRYNCLWWHYHACHEGMCIGSLLVDSCNLRSMDTAGDVCTRRYLRSVNSTVRNGGRCNRTYGKRWAGSTLSSTHEIRIACVSLGAHASVSIAIGGVVACGVTTTAGVGVWVSFGIPARRPVAYRPVQHHRNQGFGLLAEISGERGFVEVEPVLIGYKGIATGIEARHPAVVEGLTEVGGKIAERLGYGSLAATHAIATRPLRNTTCVVAVGQAPARIICAFHGFAYDVRESGAADDGELVASGREQEWQVQTCRSVITGLLVALTDHVDVHA